HSFQCASDGKNAFRVGVADYFVKLEKINPVGLKAAQGFIDLASSGRFRASIDLGHEKGLLTIAVAQSVAHADFTLAAVVVPTVVEKIDSFIEARPDDANAFLWIHLFAEMIAAKPDERDSLSAAAQRSIRYAILGFRWQNLLVGLWQEKGRYRKSQESPPGNAGIILGFRIPCKIQTL